MVKTFLSPSKTRTWIVQSDNWRLSESDSITYDNIFDALVKAAMSVASEQKCNWQLTENENSE